MATGIDRFNEIYDNGIKSGENKGKAVKNSEQVDRFNAMYEKSGAGYIAYKKYMENAAKLSQEIQSDYADRAGQWQSAETLAQNKADTLAAFNQLGNKDALLSYGYAISDPKQRRAYFDSILSVDDYKGNILQSHDDESAFYGQWKSDDEYKKSEAYFVSTYNDSLPDWEEKSKADRTLAGDGIGMDHQYYYINDLPVKFSNGTYGPGYRFHRSFQAGMGGVLDDGDFVSLQQMTAGDIERYNYLYATQGKEAAQLYINSIQNRLNYEQGEWTAQQMINKNNFEKIFSAAPVGVESFSRGIRGLVSEDEDSISPYALAGQNIRDSMDSDFLKGAYDLVNTTSNMIPSIAASTIANMVLPGSGAIIGSALMGASSAGNSRQEALRQGYTQEQAWAYGLTIGTLEGSLQYILGGIGKLGGKGSSFVLKKLGSTSAGQAVSRYVANLSNGTLSAVLQAGGKLAKNMASEGFEEYLQDVINPLVRNITLGEDNEWGLKNFVSEDAIYSGILGALSAGVLEGGSTVSGVYNAHKAGQAALDSGVYKGAIDYAKLLDPECDAYQIASELQSGKRKENAANIGALYEAVSEYIAESKKLVKKGKMTTDQYAGGVEALRQLADVRAGADAQRAQQVKAAQPSSAEVQTAANAASAPVLDSAVYDAVRAVESNENSAVKAANIIARIESGNSKISAAELSYISSPATKARQILQQRTGIDMGTTASQARNAVKEYISQRSASVSQETVNKRSAELREAKAQSAAVNNDLSASLGFDAGTVGSAGTEAYTNHYSALKTEQGQRYFNSAFAKLYQAGMQGVPFKKISGNPDLQGMSVSTQAEIYNAAAKDYQAVNQIKAETKKAVHDRVREIRQRVREQKNSKTKKEYAEIDKKLLEKREVKAGTFTIDERIDRAKLSGKQKAAVKYLKALSEVAGVNVNIYSGVDQNGTVTAENGYYDPQTNTIYVSVNAGMSSVNAFAESAILRTASHEITHMIKASGTELYVDLRDYVIDTYVQEYGQNGLTERILDIQERHREIVGKELTYEQAEEELVSSACEMMLKNSKAFEKLAKRNLTLAQRVKSALDAFISRAQKMLSEAFEGNSANSAEARLMQASVERMEKLQQLWDRALLDAVGREVQEKENIKFSFAGASAKNADLSLLAQAQIKIENGENAETVRQETGWYKGYDGKWRFEIDDSEITLKEKDITSGTSKIGDVLADCELLKAYPQLKDITISARPMLLMGNTNGWFSAANNEIVLNSRFLENAQVNHELEALYRTNEYKEYNAQMQEAADERNVKRSEIVKEYEELCNSKEYADYTERWNKADDADNKGLMNRIEREWRASEKGKRFYELQNQLKEISQDNILDRITNEFQRTETGKRYLELVRASEGNDIVNNEATKKVLVHELQHAVQQIEEFASGANLEFWKNHINEANDAKTPTELYHLTAGEIEARDAAARLSYDMEQRRNTRPDIDQKHVVFADGEIVFYASSEEKGTIKEQLKAHLTEINKMKPVASIINEGRKGMSREQQVDAIMSDYNRKFKGGVPRQNFGFVEINENLVRGSLRYIYTDAEYAAFYAIPNVIKNGIEISEHRNHKGRSYETLTIAAPVNINGSRGNVAVVIKQTGKNRYKTHRILMPNGSEFILQNIKNEELTGADMLANNNNQGTAISSSSIINISNSDKNVNRMLELWENPAQKKFENDVDAVMNGTYKSDAMLILGRTPKMLEAIGLNALPVAITPNHVYSIAATEQEAVRAGRYRKGTNYHGLGADAVKQIYQKLSDPIAVIAHPDFAVKNKRDSVHKVVVLVDLSVNGKQVIAPIIVDYEGMYNGKHIDVNLVASYFDKSNVGDFLKEAVALETNHKVGFFYGKKERIRQLLMKSGHQLPSRLNNSDSNIIIRRIDENVNREINTVLQSRQFIRWFGDWQNNPQNASKVVSEDGTPKMVYRGSKSDFAASELRNNQEITRAVENGFYFTDMYSGDNASEPVYLNIRNPFVLTDENRQTAQRDILRGNYDGIIDADNGAYFVYRAEQVKSAVDNIGTFDGKNANIRYELRINEAVEKAIRNKGQLETEYNQQRISPVPENIAKMVLQASNGKIDIAGKYFAISGGDLYHEYVRHSNAKTEQSKNQIALTAQDIKKAVRIFYQPDIVECIFEDGDNPSGRKSFAFAKKDSGYILVVESVGGRHNPNIVPVMILHITEGKWNRWIDSGKSIAEMVYESSPKYLESIKNNAENIKNRVTAARFAETQPPLNAPHSPRSNSIISGLDGNVNAEAKNIKNRVTAARFAETQPPQSAPRSPRSNAIISELDATVNREQAQASRYSYDALVRKPDMPVTPLRSVSPQKLQEYVADHRKFAREMMQLARKAGHVRNTEKTTWLRNNDLNSDIMVSTESFKHSAARMDAAYVRVCMSMSDIVKNAVAVNELPPRQNTAGAYVLLGMAHDGNEYTAVRMVVNKKTWKMEDYHILYAVRETQIKEKVSGSLPPGSSTRAISGNLLSPNISIQDMLQLVKKNNLISSVLSEDALQKIQATRGSDVLGESVLYELRSDPAQAEWEKPITAEDVNTLRSVGRKSVNEFTSEDIQKTQKWAHKFYKELGEKSPFFRAWFGDWRAYDTTPFKLKALKSLNILNRTEADIYFKKGLKEHSLFRGDVLNNDTKFKINIGQKVYNDTLTYAAREFSRNGDFNGYLNRISLLNNISAITKDAVLLDTIVAKENSINPDQSFVHQFYDACQIGEKSFIVKLIVDELNSQSGTIRRSYNVNSIEISPAAVSQVYKPASTASDSGDVVSVHTVADLFALVKESDANFQPKAAAAALLNANGTPRQLYRWESKNGRRTNFGEGTYFTASKALAERAGSKVAPAYVKLENPYTVYGTAFSKADYAEIGAWAGMQVSAKNVTEALQALGYDGVIARSAAGSHPISTIVAFDSAQTKASENVGTFDRANNDIRYELRSDPEQAEWEKPITVEDVDTLRSVGRKSVNEFTSEDIRKTQKWAHKFYKELGEKSPFFRAWFGDWRAYDQTQISYVPVNDSAISRDEIPRIEIANKDTSWVIKSSADGIDETSAKRGKWSNEYHALKDIRAMVSNAVLLDTVVVSDPSKRMGKGAVFVHHLYAPVLIKNNKAVAKLYVTENITDSKKFYLTKIEKVSNARGLNAPDGNSAAFDTKISIAEIFDFVKRNDVNYEADSKNPVYFSPNSVNASLLNANGTPQQLYRWESKNGARTNFGEGTYFTASKALAERAGSKVAPAYVKLENPYTVYGTAFSKADYAEIGAWASMQVSAKNVTEALQALGYDGVIARSAAGSHPILAAVAFDSAQTKSSENVGAFDPANADIRYELRNTDDGKIDKQSKNLLDEENLRSYNKRGRRSTKQDVSLITMKSYYHHAWATNELTGVLDADEIGMFNAAVGNIKNGTGRGYRRLSNDLYLVDVGTYFQGEKQVLIVTDADYEAPSIECVYRIDFEQAKNVSLVKEEIYDVELVQREIFGATFTYDRVASEESAYHRYTRESAFSFQEFDEQRRERSAGEGDRGYYRSRQGRSGYLSEAGSVGATNESRVINAPSDLTQNQSSENVGTFDNTDADIRYELREYEQGELNDNEIKSIHRTRGMALIEQILNQVPNGERQSLADVFSFIYSKAINAESVHDLESLNGARAFPGKLLQLIYDAAKEDVQNYKLYKKKFFNDLDRRLNELKSKPDYSQEIGEQGKLFENVEDWPVREIIEYNELSYKGNPEEVKKEIEKLSAQKREAIKFLDKLCQVSGIKIEISLNENPDKTADGGYSDYEKMIRISVDKKGIKRGIETGVLDTAAHEITHMLRHEAPEQYNALSDLVTQSYIQETSVEAYIGELKGIIERYNANNEHAEYLSYEQAENEFVCYACESMLRNSTVFENLAMRNQTLAQKLSEGLQQFIKRLKELLLQLRKRLFVWQGKNSLQKSFGGMEGLNDIAAVLASNVETLKGMQERWDAALIKTVENRTQFVADENHFRKALNEWKKMHRNETISFAEEEKLKRGVARQLFQNWTGEVPISGKLTQVEKVYSGKYDTYYTYDENGMQQESDYWIQAENGKYNTKKDENGQTIEFELGATKYTKFFSYGTQESLDNVINTDSKEAKRLKDNGEFSLEAALQNAKTFFRCEIPVRMEKGHDYIVEAIVCFPAEKKKLNRTVNYEYELNKIIKEAMRTGNPVIDSTADRIFDDMVLYDVIKVREAVNESQITSSFSDSAQTQSSENVGTFDRANSDIRYELRENEQKVALGIWELEKIHMDNAKEVQEKFDSITAVKLENTATKLDKATREKLGNTMRNIYYDSMNASSVEKVRRGRDLFAKEEIQSIYDMAKEHVGKYINDLNQYRLNPNNAEFFAKLDERLKELKLKSQKDFSQEIGEQGKWIKEIDKRPKQEIAEYERLKLRDEVKKNWRSFSEADRNALRFLDRLCQATGIRMEVGFESERSKILNEGGRYNPYDRKICIFLEESSVLTEAKNLSKKLNSSILSTAAHEITHWIQDSNSELYELLHDYVIQTYIQQNSLEQYERRIQLLKKEYDSDDPDRNLRDIEEELVAYACEMMLKNTKAFETLAQYNRTLAQKIADGLQNFIAKLKEILDTIHDFVFESKEFLEKGSEGMKAKNDVSRLFEDSVVNLEYMQKLWDGAFMEAVENKSQFDADGALELAVNEWKEKFPNREMSSKEEEMLRRGLIKEVFNLFSGIVPISGKLMQVENVFSGEYDKTMRFGSQTKEGGYSEKKDGSGRVIEFELGTTKYTKYYDYYGGDLEMAQNDLKTFFRCEVPVKMDDGDYIAEVIVGFPAEKDGRNGKVNYEYELNKIIKEAMHTGNPVVDSTADRIFDDMVLYDVIKVRKADEQQ